MGTAQVGPEGETAQEDENGEHKVNTEEADGPVKSLRLLADIEVAPVFVAQAAPAYGPVGRQANGPQAEQGADEQVARVGKPI